MSIVGFFGERNTAADHEVEHQVERVNAQMIAEFDEFPMLLGYASRLQTDRINYANLVVLAGSDGIEKWRDVPRHLGAASELAPEFYSSVRIYNGSLQGGLSVSEQLTLFTVKYWDYGVDGVLWHAIRRLAPE